MNPISNPQPIPTLEIKGITNSTRPVGVSSARPSRTRSGVAAADLPAATRGRLPISRWRSTSPTMRCWCSKFEGW